MKKLLIIFTLISQITLAQSPGDMLKNMMSGKKATVKSVYNFSASIKYEMSTSKKDQKITFKYLLPADNEEAIGTEFVTDATKGKTVRSVIDMKNHSMLMLMDEQKMAMAMPLDLEKTAEEAQKSSNTSTTFTPPVKTGKTKTILGYTCDEWVSDNTDTKTAYWIGRNVNLPIKGLYETMKHSMMKTKNSKMTMPAGFTGAMLEMDNTNKKNGETMTMICTEINANQPTKISTAGYQIMGAN